MRTNAPVIRIIALLCMLLLAVCFATACTGEDNPVESSGVGSTDAEAPDGTAPETEGTTTPESDVTTAPGGETAPEETKPEDTKPVVPKPDDDPALNVFPEGDQNIEIGIFYESPAQFTTPEQYDWIRDANITFIEVTNQYTNPESKELQLQLASERGINISWYGHFDGINMVGDSFETITEYAQSLAQKDSAITGVHIIDEPHNPYIYANAIAAVSEGGLMPYFNFLPYWAIDRFENYNGYVEDTVIATGKDNFGYLRYDEYPFRESGGDPNMFYNLEIFREIGLKYDVPTGFYIQGTAEPGSFRRPNEGEIRYHTSAGLAYGMKTMSYFTWWSVSDVPEHYAIISYTGEKTDLYDYVTAINAQILQVGPVLSRLDALEVYHTLGGETGITLCGPDDVPLYAKGSTDHYGYVISLMEDRETGRDYIMIVNKNYNEGVTDTFTVSDEIAHLYNLNNGEYEKLQINDGKVDITFAPGGFMLLAVGQYDNIVDREYDESANLAEGKAPAVDTVNPGNGYYAYCVTDGKRDGSDSVARGFRSAKETGWVEVDLNRVTTINRVDLYPYGTNYTRGKYFPRSFTIDVSSDGINWTTVVSKSNYTDALYAVPSFTFDSIEARYVRLNVTESGEKGYFEIAEIEIYNDNGSIPAPDNDSLYAGIYGEQPAGTNVAFGREVEVSSYATGLDHVRLTNGSRRTGWTSGINRNSTENAEEWFMVDLDLEYTLDRIVLYAQKNDVYFPKQYRIEVSTDGKTFETVYDGAVPEPRPGLDPIEITLGENVQARYVRVTGYVLRDQVGYEGDGYMFSCMEIEIYNR